MEGLILSSVKTGSEELVVGRNEGRINDDFVRRVNQKLGEKRPLRLAGERVDIEAGFILRQGKRRINASLDVMLKVASQELEGKLSEYCLDNYAIETEQLSFGFNTYPPVEETDWKYVQAVAQVRTSKTVSSADSFHGACNAKTFKELCEMLAGTDYALPRR
jgi:hypothetical protein